MNFKKERAADKPGVIFISVEPPRYTPPERSPEEKEWNRVVGSIFTREMPDERWTKIARQIGRE